MERSDMEDESLGGKFWLSVFGIIIAVGIGAILVFLLISGAWYKWGFLGAMIFVGAILLFIAWIYDRRHAGRLKAEDY
jgi:membrane protein implicated in regulation of membrane protease activity